MKLSILLAGSILTSAIVGNVYAQTCGAQPSCSDLGYSYTGSTSDCVGPALKCPFNTSYFNCTKKADALSKLQADIVTAAMPNYQASSPRSNNVTYTASTNGYIYGIEKRFGSCGEYNQNTGVYINDRNLRITSYIYGSHFFNYFSFPVKKGDTYRVAEQGAHTDCFSIEYYFAPLS